MIAQGLTPKISTKFCLGNPYGDTKCRCGGSKSLTFSNTHTFRIFFLPLSILYLLFPNWFSNLVILPSCFLVSSWSFCHSHMFWADSSIIPFICCQWSFTPRPFHFTSSTLSPTMHLNSSHVFSSLSFHARTLGTTCLTVDYKLKLTKWQTRIV